MELDLFERGVDYRDFYRPGGGGSRLTLRRLLLLVDGMDPFNSRFWAEVHGFDYVPMDVRVQADTFEAFAQRRHPVVAWREEARLQREKRERIAAIKRAVKERRRRLGA